MQTARRSNGCVRRPPPSPRPSATVGEVPNQTTAEKTHREVSCERETPLVFFFGGGGIFFLVLFGLEKKGVGFFEKRVTHKKGSSFLVFFL